MTQFLNIDIVIKKVKKAGASFVLKKRYEIIYMCKTKKFTPYSRKVLVNNLLCLFIIEEVGQK